MPLTRAGRAAARPGPSLLLALLSPLCGCSSSGENGGASPDLGSPASGPDSGVDLRPADARPGDDLVAGPSPDLSQPPPTGADVTQFHRNSSRDGVYLDPAFTVAKVAGLTRDASFAATFSGNVYAQPLYIEGGPAGRAVVIVATEGNDVIALDARDGSQAWKKNLGAPALGNNPCGNISPLGITGTPVVDLATRTLFVDAMTSPQGGPSRQHLIFALRVDDGAVLPGYPVDVAARATYGGLKFTSAVQNQRGALALAGGVLYVAYGGHYGDCGDYHGWLLGLTPGNPPAVKSWATRARGGGAWAPGGPATDGTSVFIATGNTFGANSWQDGEAIFKFAPGPVDPMAATSYWTPANWKALDDGDIDLGGSGALLVEVPGATPSKLVVALGKDGNAYLINRDNLGGIGGEVAKKKVSSSEIIQAAATYQTARGTYVVFNGNAVGCPNGGGDLGAFRISAASPPAISVAWCASEGGKGSPFVTTSDGSHDVVVWGIGAEGDGRLRAFDGDTGAVLFAGGGNNEHVTGTRRFQTGIVARGRIFVAADNRVYAFKP